MTAFVEAVRAECDRVGRARGRRLMLTVLMWDTIYGRDPLKDDGLDPARWSRAGLIDRLVVLTHQVPWQGAAPTWDIKPFARMVRDTGCRIYAGCERREHAVYKQIEDTYRNMGLDGMFYLNYEVLPDSPFEEYRSPNVSYFGRIDPATAPNAWQRSESGAITLAEGARALRGPARLWRDAAMLPTGGPGVTMEATLRAGQAPTAGLCGFTIADGKRAASLGFRGGSLVLSEADRPLAEIELDATAWHTLRLTLDAGHQARAYLDERPEPVATATLGMQTDTERITWGHLDVPPTSTAHSRWRAVHYTLQGAFAPTQRRFAP